MMTFFTAQERPPGRRRLYRALPHAAAVLCFLALLHPVAGRAADWSESEDADFGEMAIEDLMRIKLSLSRRDESLSQSAAAAYIVTNDELRRSGATTIPEALRMVPGIEVARVDAHTWAVTARGFNDTFANKLLVMIDGRTVYTPLFSGVFWDVQDTMFEDIDHIEIIRGPGSMLWGANAVNGVINIVTKRAADTQGGLVVGGAGTEERGFGAVRYGGQISEQAHYRAYVKYFDRDESALPGGGDAKDDWRMLRGGFRMDWTPGRDVAHGVTEPPDLFTLQGDIYDGRVAQNFAVTRLGPPAREQFIPDAQHVIGGNVLGRWTHEFSEASNLKVQAYYDRTRRSLIIFEEIRDTFDLDFQHRFKLGERNDLVWGAAYRVTSDETDPSQTVALIPESRTLHLFSTFVQDDLTVVEDRLRFTLGSKLEHNDLTGWEVQPGARLLWTPATNHTVWASVTRAVRTPSRAEDDVRVNAVVPPGVVASIVGDRDSTSERLIAYELGYRVQPAPRLSLDVATFFNDYDDLRTLEFGPPPPGALVGQIIDNRMKGETFGVELASTWQPVSWWTLRGSYTWFRLLLDLDASSRNPANLDPEGRSPRHRFMIQSRLDLPGNWEFDCGLRYVDALSAFSIPSYFALDARLGWRPTENLEFSVVGQNLLDDRHPEFQPTIIRTWASEVERAVYGKVTWRF